MNQFGTLCAVLSQITPKHFMEPLCREPQNDRSRPVRLISHLLLLLTFLLWQSTSTMAQTRKAGEFAFATAKLDTSEGDPSALLTVTRTKGWDGKMLVDVILVASTNNAAVTALPATNTITFNDFQTSAQLAVPIKENGLTNANRTITFVLDNPRPADGEISAFLPTLSSNKVTALQVIDNDDAFSYFFSQSVYYASETDPFVRVYIRLVGAPEKDAQEVTVDYKTETSGGVLAGNDLANAGADYEATSGTVTFGPDDMEIPVDIPISRDAVLEFNEEFMISLRNAKGSLTVAETNVTNYKLGKVSFARIVIINNGDADSPQAVGGVDPKFNADNILTTNPPLNQTPGANNTVLSVVPGLNDTIVLGGLFTSVNSTPRSGVARMKSDGELDASFAPAGGANDFVSAVASYLQGTNEGKVIAVGGFTSMSGVQRNSIARLLEDGKIDPSFDPGTGANGSIHALSIDPDEKVLIAGDFTTYDGVPRNRVARLLSNGNLDLSFNPGSGANDVVFAILSSSSTNGTNAVIIAGDFTSVDGNPATRIARLNNDGSFDIDFDVGLGADSTVYAIAEDSSGRVIIGGAFQMFNSVPQRGLVRLLSNGVLDRGFVTGSGPDDTVSSISLQADGKVYIGGRFLSYNYTRRVNVARLFSNGTLDTSFLDTAFNQYAGFPNPAGFAPISVIYALTLDASDNLVVGGSFTHVGGGLTRTSMRPRSNIARLVGGAGRAPGNVEFASKNYGVDEGGGSMVTAIRRIYGDLGSMAVQLFSRDGAALSGADYTGLTNIQMWLPVPANTDLITGDTRSATPMVKIVDDKLMEGDENFELLLGPPVGQILLGGEIILTFPAQGEYSKASAIILDNDFGTSVLNFAATSYDLDENTGQVTVNVVRSGNLSAMVSVKYMSISGTNSTDATAGADYTTTSGSLTFSGGQTNKSFTIQVRDDQTVELDEVVSLTLFSASPGASIGTNSTAILTIIDNDFAPGRIGFASTALSVSELDGKASITVKRTGGNVGVITVGYGTVNDTAFSPYDYLEVSGTLTWNDQDTTPRTILVPIYNDGIVEKPERFILFLTNAVPNGAIGLRSTNTVTIQDDDNYGKLAFTLGQYLADENGTNSVITVIRRGGSAESVSVDFTTVTNTAIEGKDYTHTNGTLTFGPGEMSKSFVIPILDDALADGERRVLIKLGNATNAVLGVLTNATLFIVDNESKNIPAGSVDTDFATTGGAGGAINTLLLQPDGKLLVGGEFILMNRQTRQHVARENSDGTLDITFAEGLEVDGSVRSMVLQSTNNKVYIVGAFSNVNGFPYKYLARLTSAGALDNTFNPGSGPDNPVHAAAETFVDGNRKVIIGGAFTVYNGIARRGIARVNDNGATDKAFDPGSGIDGTVYSIVVERDGRILIAGDFTSVDGVPRNSLARLNIDGSLDLSFDPKFAPDSAIRSIVVDFDDSILIGGVFNSVGGVTKNSIARLKVDGSLDLGFDVGLGASGPIYTMAVQQDGKILAAGDFNEFGGLLSNRITRLNPDGSSDPTINFGAGANGFIASIAVQNDRQIMIGGGFTEFDGTSRKHLARLYGGSFTGSGSVEFLAPAYTILESLTNSVVIVRRTGGLSGSVGVTLKTEPFTAEANVDYVDVTTNLVFAQGESFKKVWVPVINDNLAEPDKTLQLYLTNYTGGVSSGNQPFTLLTVVSEDSVIGFSESVYSVNETAVGGRASVSLQRDGVTAVAISVTLTTQNGTASSGSDYTAVNTVVNFDVGQTVAVVAIPITDDNAVEGNETITLVLSAPSNGAMLGVATATLTISDNDFAPGVLSLASTYTVTEGAENALITVSRTGGRAGIVGIDYWTDSLTATANTDYTGVSGTLLFLDGEVTKTIKLPITQDLRIEGNETLRLTISTPTGGAALGSITTSIITITDDDFGPGSFDSSFSIPGGIAGAVGAGVVRSMNLLEDGKILIGGSFTSVGGVPRRDHARLQLNGSLDASYTTGSGITGINAMVISGAGKIYVGATDSAYVGLRSANGAADSTFAQTAGLNGPVYAVLPQEDGKVIVGGGFTQPAAGLIRLDRNGALDISLNPDGGFGGGVVNQLVSAGDGAFYVGGNFTSAGGLPRSALVRILSTGLLDGTFNAGSGNNGTVLCILPLADGKLLVAGEFTTFNGVSRTRIARLTPAGKVDGEYKPANVNGTVRALALAPNGKLYIGGDFTTVGGEPRVRLALLGKDGSLDFGFDPGQGPDASVYDLALQADGQLLIAGAFTKVNGFASTGVARVNGERAVPLSPVITSVKQLENGDVRLVFESEAGRTYILEISTNLKTWSSLSETISTGNTTEITDSALGEDAARFYRLTVKE